MKQGPGNTKALLQLGEEHRDSDKIDRLARETSATTLIGLEVACGLSCRQTASAHLLDICSIEG